MQHLEVHATKSLRALFEESRACFTEKLLENELGYARNELLLKMEVDTT